MTSIRSASFWKNLFVKILRILVKNTGVSGGRETHHQHVVPHPDGWAVRGEGNTRVTAIFDRQEEAIERARDIAFNYRADVIIHRQDGTIRDRISYR